MQFMLTAAKQIIKAQPIVKINYPNFVLSSMCVRPS